MDRERVRDLDRERARDFEFEFETDFVLEFEFEFELFFDFSFFFDDFSFLLLFEFVLPLRVRSLAFLSFDLVCVVAFDSSKMRSIFGRIRTSFSFLFFRFCFLELLFLHDLTFSVNGDGVRKCRLFLRCFFFE